MTPEVLIKNFNLIDEDSYRHEYLIDLAHDLPSYPDEYRNEMEKIEGCATQVYMLKKEQSDGRIYFYFTSDSLIVNGLLFILYSIFNGKTKAEISKIDPNPYLDQMKISEILTNQRQMGLASIIEKIKND